MSTNRAVRAFHYQSKIGVATIRLVGLIEDAIRVHGINPELLVFEVTESSFALEEDIFLRTLYDLKKLGVSLAIDDFGTGYFNMYSLKTMPLDLLRIDRSFISGVETDSRDRSIYRAIMAMAQHLGLRVVAEGVENSGQLEFLQSIGCNEVQGYFFGRPMSAEEYEKIYLSERRYGALPVAEKRYSE
ncbi:MAG: EAL domain-containing protein [Gammaproteobacteria bacterium]